MSSHMFDASNAHFVAHECCKPALETLDLLKAKFNCTVQSIQGDTTAPVGSILLVSAYLERSCYLRILPRLPNTDRTVDAGYYKMATRFGWHEGAGGLVIVNTKRVGSSGFFETARAPTLPNHRDRFENALAVMLGKKPERLVKRPRRQHGYHARHSGISRLAQSL